MVQEKDAVDVVDFPPPKSLFQLLKEALGGQSSEFAAAALLAGSLPGPNADMAVWWHALAKQRASSQPQGPHITTASTFAQQQSGLQMLCEPVVVR